MDILGFNLAIDNAGLLIGVMVIGTIFLIIAFYSFFYFNNLHPIANFKIFSRTGTHTRKYRLFRGKVPTRMGIIELMLGKKPFGFLIANFKQDYYDGKQFYVAQYVDGRLFPLPLADVIDNQTFSCKICEKCRTSLKEWDSELTECSECEGKLIFEPVVINGLDLHALKFNPELEKRYIYKMDIDGRKIPVSECAQVYDIGGKIAEQIAESTDVAQEIVDKHNPFLTVLIATAPMTIILLVFAFTGYIMWQANGQAFKEGADVLTTASENNLKAIEMLVNATKPIGAG